jgi:predicted phage tail protein
MKKIILHGHLAKHGPVFEWDVKTPQEALRGLVCQIPGFRRDLSIGHYYLVMKTNQDYALSKAELYMPFPRNAEFHVIPALVGAKGSKGKTMGKIAVGVALVALSVAGGVGAFGAAGAASGFGTSVFGAAATGIGASITYGSVGLMGVSLLLGGVTSLLTPKPKTPSYSQRESPDERASFLFQNGAVNVTEQGGPVPLVYGRFRSGSVTVSAGLTTEQVVAT